MSAATAHHGTPVALALERASLVIDGRVIVDHVDLHFAPGTLTALVGPNGAGKSSLLSLAAGDRRPSEGEVRVGGRPLQQWRVRELARERAVMPQDHSVRFGFGVREVVAMGRLPHDTDADHDDAIVEASLTTADLLGLADRNVQTLSGGEAARTAFARVLAQDAPVVLLDEPTAALDLHHQERLLRHARRLANHGACVLAVLHDLNLASAYSDRIVMLCDGRVVADGTPREVLQRGTIERVYRQPVLVIEHPTRGVPLVLTEAGLDDADIGALPLSR
ncbi:heme ABC transporter ATP-binding protein [Luteimonas yindakuii]|uniref:Heme ABC transporter ATP-binding protein n=1 Tax=Luteimonas yindakuii TaxID=2565782 RepID=A0A4Z1RIL2_9GAMM|nr:heme ABC transporter ATP-binding protein [Luteimonas yindakuii]TKS53491.1 heme ABC transporter ATP-binding protein [Luteimonas yindakuii]